jgi:uncharacterized membrane protein
VSAAAADHSRTGGSPRRQLLITLVAISVALNLFFVAGALWTRLHASNDRADTEQRYEQMAAELKLDPRQRAAFDRYVAGMRSRVEDMHRQVDPLIGSAWEEIAKPQTETAQVMQLFDQATDKRRSFQRELTTETLAFLAQLSPEQRGTFVTIAREHRAPWSRSRRPAR